MAEPQFDTHSGRWYIRYHVSRTERAKKYVPKHPGWKKLPKRPRTVPDEVLAFCRHYQELDMEGKSGQTVKIARSHDIETFLREYRESYAMDRKANSQKGLGHAVRRFLDFCRSNKIETVEAVNVPVCRKHVEDMVKAGLAYNTIDVDKGLLSGAWTRAVMDEVIEKNPWALVRTPGKKDSEGTPTWTNSEVIALLGALKGWARDVFLVGINSGLRCQAIRHMRWGWINWSPKNRRRGIITCPEEWSKNGSSYTVPLFPDLHDVLARRLAEAEDTSKNALVFPGKCADGGINASGFHQTMVRAAKRAKVEWRGHAWHIMRSTFATRYLEAGASPRSVQAWMSHSSLKMTDKYLGWSNEAEDDEVDRLESKMKPGEPDPKDDP